MSKYRTPGQLIAAAVEERGWNSRILAVVLGLGETSVSKMIADKQSVTVSTALALEELFGIGAEVFLDLQKDYDLAKARYSTAPDPARSTRAHLFGDLPITEMIKRGWLEATEIRDVDAVESALIKFFGATTVDDIEILPHAPKKTNVAEGVTPSQLAWLYRVRQIASGTVVGRYSPLAGRRAVVKLQSLLSAPEEARKVPRILAESGIRFALVETLSTAKIDGVCFWLSEDAPVIGLSTRYDRIDNFWFVLRHELEHVLNQDGQDVIRPDVELEGERASVGGALTEDERTANAAAAAFCIPPDQMEKFVARKSPFFAERDVIGFARTLDVHPGLVAGRIQHDTGRYELFRKHLVKIRDKVRPAALVDGWGDVAPVGG